MDFNSENIEFAFIKSSRRRNALDYSYLPQHTTTTDNGISASGNLPAWLYRGYTGHEHLDEFALINMNARLYDPVLGMMLSPDNYIQDPSFTQNYNRYGYCFNNPLRYTDPDGNWAVFDDAVAITIGAAFGAWQGYKIGVAQGKTWDDGLWKYTLIGAGIGAVAGEAALYTGGAAVGAFGVGANAILVGAAAGAVGGATAGFINGAGMAYLGGASFNDGLMAGGKGFLLGAATGAVTGAAAGWFSTTSAGQKFGAWRASHSKGRYFDSSNSLSLIYKESQQYDGLIDHKQAEGSMDCLEIALESIDEYQGGQFNPRRTNGIHSDTEFDNAVQSKNLKVSYQSKKNHGHTNHEIGDIAKNNMGHGKNTLVLSKDHALNVKGYDYYPNWGKNGRYVIYYNNPAPRSSQYFDSKDVINIYSIWR
jgi:RHS repeat-associated protein